MKSGAGERGRDGWIWRSERLGELIVGVRPISPYVDEIRELNDPLSAGRSSLLFFLLLLALLPNLVN